MNNRRQFLTITGAAAIAAALPATAAASGFRVPTAVEIAARGFIEAHNAWLPIAYELDAAEAASPTRAALDRAEEKAERAFEVWRANRKAPDTTTAREAAELEAAVEASKAKQRARERYNADAPLQALHKRDEAAMDRRADAYQRVIDAKCATPADFGIKAALVMFYLDEEASRMPDETANALMDEAAELLKPESFTLPEPYQPPARGA